VRAAADQASALLGEHTNEVLADAPGTTDAAIGRLYESGVVGGPARETPVSRDWF
jgi:hypothetical protein